jgi:hypothetical protein
MHRTFIALIVGSTMAMTSLTAAPVEARDRGETATVAAGVAVLALVAAAIAKRKRQDQLDVVARDQGHHGRPEARYHDRGYQAVHRPASRGHDAGYRQSGRVQLPGACRVQNAQRAGYSGRCLQRYDYGHAALPSACAVRVGGNHRTIYRDRCLNGYGYY